MLGLTFKIVYLILFALNIGYSLYCRECIGDNIEAMYHMCWATIFMGFEILAVVEKQ